MADEIKGTITKVDVDGKKVTVKVDDKETTYDVADNAKLPARGKNPGTLKTLDRAVTRAADKGGYKAVVTTDKDTKKVTAIAQDKSKPKTPPPPQE